MRIVKIILGIVVALTLVFFATGLIVKEVGYISEVVVKKPLKEVFVLFEDPQLFKKWMHEVHAVEVISQTPQKIGSEYKLTVAVQDQQTEVKKKILAYVKNQKITFRYITDGLIKVDDYVFSKQGENTKIVQYSSIRSNSFMLACTFPWFKSKFKQMSQRYLNKFKSIVEDKSITK